MANIEYMRRTRDLGLLFYSDEPTPEVAKVAYYLIPNSVFYQNELTVARAHQEWFLPIMDVGQHSVSPATARMATTNIYDMRSHWSPNNIIAAMLLPALVPYAK